MPLNVAMLAALAVTEQETHTMQHFARVVGEAFRRNDFAEVVTDPALEAGGAN